MRVRKKAPIKGKSYTDNTDRFSTYTYTGKTQKGRHIEEADLMYIFIREPKDAELKGVIDPVEVYKADYYFDEHMS